MSDNDSLSPIERNLPQRITDFAPTTLDLEAQGGEPHFNLASFWHIVIKRLGTIITGTVVVLVLTGVYTFEMAPVYRATLTVEVETSYTQLQSLNEVYRQTGGEGEDSTFLATQVEELKSDSLAWTTMQQLGIDRQAAVPATGANSGKSPAQIAAARKTMMIAGFKGGLKVEIEKGSRILQVSYEGGNPDLAANIVNTLINNYIDSNFQARNDFTRRASGGMEQQLQDLKMKVEQSQTALFDYERQNLIINVGDKETASDQRLEELSRDYTGAEAERVQKESLYDLAKANQSEIGFIVQDPILQNLEGKYNDLKASYADALDQYGPNFPKVVRLRDQLTQLQSLMENARKQAIKKVHNDYLSAVNKEKMLGDVLMKEKENVAALNHRMIEHNILRREFEDQPDALRRALATHERRYAFRRLASSQRSYYRSRPRSRGTGPPEQVEKHDRRPAGRFSAWDHSGLRAGSPRQLGADYGRSRKTGKRSSFGGCSLRCQRAQAKATGGG